MKIFCEVLLQDILFGSFDELVDPMKFAKKGEDPFADYRKYHQENGGNERFKAKYDSNKNRIWK